METWQLQDAKNGFSRLVAQAKKDGPQVVTKHGIEAVVVLSFEEYQRLIQRKKKLVDVLLAAPAAELPIERSKEKVREISF
ncbi:MAG: type II toxin-antitoxin system Phd/YefM family antitoxin [Deltaproteobacteria bacterium]|nr:type II toxin-antitoxin system Phd/YefM family antitoxin [Deltaproteobacteria bacterium]